VVKFRIDATWTKNPKIMQSGLRLGDCAQWFKFLGIVQISENSAQLSKSSGEEHSGLNILEKITVV